MTPNSTLPNTPSKLITVLAAISAGTSLSELVYLKDHALSAIIIPAIWTTAAITLQASIDGSSFFNVYTAAGTEYTVASTTANRYILIPASDLPAVRYLYIRSGTSGAPVNQASTTTLTVICK